MNDDNLLINVFTVLMCVFYLWHYMVLPISNGEINEDSK